MMYSLQSVKNKWKIIAFNFYSESIFSWMCNIGFYIKTSWNSAGGNKIAWTFLNFINK